jgi:hypothetical protein
MRNSDYEGEKFDALVQSMRRDSDKAKGRLTPRTLPLIVGLTGSQSRDSIGSFDGFLRQVLPRLTVVAF